MPARLRQRIHWLKSLFLLWTAVTTCLGEGSIHSVSLNMDGLLNVTNHNRNVVAVVCRVVHNSTTRSTYFYINDTKLEGIHALERDQTIRVASFSDCFMPPPDPQQCEELMLVLRTTAAINNTEITCRSRARGTNAAMGEARSHETITVIVEDAVSKEMEPPSCSSPSLSPSPSPSPSTLPHTTTLPDLPASPSPSPTEVPSVYISENKSPSVPEGNERWYAAALAAETVLLIAAVITALFLLCCVCRKQKYNLADPVDSHDAMATYQTAISYTSEAQHNEDKLCSKV